MEKHNCPLCLSENTSLIYEGAFPSTSVREYYSCQRCFLVFVPKKFHLTNEQEKQRYDLHQNSALDPGYINFLNKLTDPLKGFLQSDWEGLDYGCGPGPAIDHILGKDGFRISNYDPFYYPNRKLLEKKYDFITCSEVVEHLRDPQKEFMRFDRLLKEEGSVLGIMTEVWSQEVDFGKWWYPNEPTHICFYRQKTFKWIAQWLGWTQLSPHKNIVLFQK